MDEAKELVKKYWNNEPCGTGRIKHPECSLEYYEAMTERRNRFEPFIAKYAQFEKWKDKKVLEVGCGVGNDLIRFVRAGAHVTGIDLTPKSVYLTNQRLSLYNYKAEVFEADAENMPFEDNTFDLVYSWGVLHHTPDTEKAIREVRRVTKGEICVMLYHKHSLVALQMYILFGLLALRPFRSLDDIFANCQESIGTKAYTVSEAQQMFSAFSELNVEPCLTPYDLRYGRDKHLPLSRFVPQRFGFFMVIQGKK